MAQRIVLYWRDIPAQVIIRDGRKSEKRELPERFIQAIDTCAMRTGAKDSNAYLGEWRRGAAEPCSGNLAAEADRAFRELDELFDPERLNTLLANGGFAKVGGED